ncbi:hypothetical protein EDD11_001988 [Mortierella claussenii]|nr:hypothetical protein EDD11_001988 [Mortierella claussenii]
MSLDNAIDLPEIRSLVGSFLACKDLAQCVLVSKSWRASFTPLLWRDVVIHSRHPRNSTHLPPLPKRFRPLFRTHAHLTKSLVFKGGPLTQDEISLGAHCTHLTHLSLSATVSADPRSWTHDTDSSSSRSRTWSILQQDIASEDEIDHGDSDGNDHESDHESAVSVSDEGHEDEQELVLVQGEPWDQLAALVQQNQTTLKSLDIILDSPQGPKIPTRKFWETLAQCFPPQQAPFGPSSRLTHLCMSGREIKLEDLLFLWRAAGPHLKRFEFWTCKIEWRSLPALLSTTAHDIVRIIRNEALSPSAALEHLELINVTHMSARAQFEMFIEQSPRLRTLTWKIWTSLRRLLVQNISESWSDPQEHSGQWPDLESVVIMGERGSEAIPDGLLATFVENAGSQLRLVELHDLRVGDRTLQGLERHFSHLQTLKLTLCSQVTGSTVQQILTSCPALEHIAANSIHVQDMVESREPWVCLGLRSWQIFIDLSPRGDVGSGTRASSLKASVHHSQDNDGKYDIRLQSQQAYKRLAMLTRLEHLDLGRHYWVARTGMRLMGAPDWRLKAGLGQLETLTELQSIQFMTWSGMMNTSKSAVMWMIRSWPKLTSVSGFLGIGKVDQKMVASLMQEHGIAYCLENRHTDRK